MPQLPARRPQHGYRADVAAFDALMTRLAPRVPALSLHAEAIAEGAMRAEGFEDWGEPGAMEGLRLLSQDMLAERPSGVGQLMASQVLLNACRLRLRAHRMLRDGQLRADAQPTRPWIVSGLHRSGTTWLQRLLEAVPGRGGVPNYRLINPLPETLPLWRARLVIGFSRWVAPEMWRWHPPHPITPDECWTLCTPSLRIYDIALHWRLPRYIEWLDQTDLTPAYQMYRRLLAGLEVELGFGPRALKSPCHIAGLGPLLKEMPQALVIWTHRDPATTVSSFCRLSALQRRTIYGGYDVARCGEATLRRAAAATRRGMEGLSVAPERVVHVAYDDLVSDPIGVVERVCERAGEPLTPEGRGAVERLISQKGDGVMSDGAYAPEDWGLSRGRIHGAMRDYVERFIAPGAPLR